MTPALVITILAVYFGDVDTDIRIDFQRVPIPILFLRGIVNRHGTSWHLE